MNKKRNKNKIKLTSLVLILSLILVIIIYNSFLLVLQTVYPRRYSSLVEQYAQEYQINEAFLYAVIETESGFNKDAVSNVGAKGLTQIMPDTFKWLQSKTGEEYEEDDLFEPEISIKYGAFLLRYLLDEFDDPKTALAAYHAGIGRVNGWLHNPEYSTDGEKVSKIPFEDTDAYATKVLKTYEWYVKLYDLPEDMKYEY